MQHKCLCLCLLYGLYLYIYTFTECVTQLSDYKSFFSTWCQSHLPVCTSVFHSLYQRLQPLRLQVSLPTLPHHSNRPNQSWAFLLTKNKSFTWLCAVVHYTSLGQACQLITTFACSTHTHLTWIQQAGQSTYGPSCSLHHPDLLYVQCCAMYNYHAQFTSYKFCPLGHKRVGYVFTSYLLLGTNSANLTSREQGRRAQHLWAFLFNDMSMSLDMSALPYHTTHHISITMCLCHLLLGTSSANLTAREQGRWAQHLGAFLFTDMSMSLDVSASAYHTTQHLQLSLSVCVTFCLVQILPTWHQALAICRGFLGLCCCLPYNFFQGKILK